MLSIDFVVTHAGKTLGHKSLTVMDTPDGGHGAVWKNRVFPCTSSTPDLLWDIGSRDSGCIDISMSYFEMEKCKECEHDTAQEVERIKPSLEDPRTEELPPLVSRGVRLLDQLKHLVLEVMLEERDCSPDGTGVSTAAIEQKTGLHLPLSLTSENTVTWSVLAAMDEEGTVCRAPGYPIAWRLTREDSVEIPGLEPEQAHGDYCEGSTDPTIRGGRRWQVSPGELPEELRDAFQRYSEVQVQCPMCNDMVMEYDKFCDTCANPL